MICLSFRYTGMNSIQMGGRILKCSKHVPSHGVPSHGLQVWSCFLLTIRWGIPLSHGKSVKLMSSFRHKTIPIPLKLACIRMGKPIGCIIWYNPNGIPTGLTNHNGHNEVIFWNRRPAGPDEEPRLSSHAWCQRIPMGIHHWPRDPENFWVTKFEYPIIIIVIIVIIIIMINNNSNNSNSDP